MLKVFVLAAFFFAVTAAVSENVWETSQEISNEAKVTSEDNTDLKDIQRKKYQICCRCLKCYRKCIRCRRKCCCLGRKCRCKICKKDTLVDSFELETLDEKQEHEAIESKEVPQEFEIKEVEEVKNVGLQFCCHCRRCSRRCRRCGKSCCCRGSGKCHCTSCRRRNPFLFELETLDEKQEHEAIESKEVPQEFEIKEVEEVKNVGLQFCCHCRRCSRRCRRCGKSCCCRGSECLWNK